MIEYNRKLKERARRLRTQMTDSERALWERLRRKQVQGVQFYRQKPIGNYIVDFYAPGAKGDRRSDGSESPGNFGVNGGKSPLNPPFRKGGNGLLLRPRIIVKTCVTYD